MTSKDDAEESKDVAAPKPYSLHATQVEINTMHMIERERNRTSNRRDWKNEKDEAEGQSLFQYGYFSKTKNKATVHIGHKASYTELLKIWFIYFLDIEF